MTLQNQGTLRAKTHMTLENKGFAFVQIGTWGYS